MPQLPTLRLTPTLLAWAALGTATLVAALIAFGASLIIERLSVSSVRSRLLTEGITWVDVSADGLQVHLSGTAPNEAARFRVVNLTAGLVDNGRIRDKMEVIPVKAAQAPRFSLEMLRNDDGIQLIGLLPEVGHYITNGGRTDFQTGKLK